MAFRWILMLVLVTMVTKTTGNPTGCTYDSTTVLYTCDSRGWVLPLTYAQFTVQPQRIFIKDMSGELTNLAPNGPIFSGFSAMNTASFDKRYPASLRILCVAGGTLIIVKDAFLDFGWVEELYFQDCTILSLPANVFSHFGELNSFTIEGGSIDNMVPDTFAGLDVKRLTSTPEPKGEFILRNVNLVDDSLEFGGLFSQGNISTLVLDNLHMTTIRQDTFSANKKLTNLSLSYNEFSSIPSGLFAGATSLQYVRLAGMSWTCSCSELWFITFAQNNNITLDGDIVCATPAAYTNDRASAYYTSFCMAKDPCAGTIGFENGDECIAVLDLIIYLFTLLAVIFTTIAFIIVFRMLLRIREIRNKRRGAVLRRLFGVDVNKNKNVRQTVKTRDPGFD